MVGPLWFVGFDSLMELVAFAIALAIAYQAFKGYTMTRQRTLFYVQFSFALLSAGLLIDSLAGFLGILARALRATMALTRVGYTLYFFAQLLAYGVLIYAYVYQAKSVSTTSASLALIPVFGLAALQEPSVPEMKLLGLLVEYHPGSEIILLFLLACIAILTGLNYSATKDRNAFLVFLGFLLLAFSHLLFILTPLNALMFVIGHLLQLLGFISLLTMLLRVTTAK